MEATDQQQPVQQPQQEAVQTQQPEVATRSNIPMIIVVVLIVAAVLLGVYIFMAGQGGEKSSSDTTAQPTQVPTASSDLEEELNALDVESNDSDFVDVDKDLESL